MNQENQQARAKLKIFFGMCAGVGKTYTMLTEAHKKLNEGVRLLIGSVNTHGRKETEALVVGLPQIAEKWVNYKNHLFRELDIETILKQKPDLVLIDELAHTNVPGSRHVKRWQDVLEILENGIDVFATINVQHVESLKGVVEEITSIQIRETVPDYILERADEIELVDIPPAELLERLREGKVYTGHLTQVAIENFFKGENLTALREVALRFTAEKVEHELHAIQAKEKRAKWHFQEKLMVAISERSSSELIHAATRRAFEMECPWIAVYVDTGEQLSDEEKGHLNALFDLIQSLGGELVTVHDVDKGKALTRVAKQRNVTQLLMGRNYYRKIMFSCLFRQGILSTLEKEFLALDLLIISEGEAPKVSSLGLFQRASSFGRYLFSAMMIVGVTAIGLLLQPWLGYKVVGFLYLLSILSLSFFVRIGPIFLASLLSTVAWDFFFVPPIYELGLYNSEEIATAALFFITAALSGFFMSTFRSRIALSEMREANREYLLEAEKLIATSNNFTEVREALLPFLEKRFLGKFEILIKNSLDQLIFDRPLPILRDEKEQTTALYSFLHQRKSGFGTDTLPTSEAFYLPIVFSGTSYGVLVYLPTTKGVLSIEDIGLLQSITERLALFLERRLSREERRSQDYVRVEEKLHHAILHSLSRGVSLPLEKILSIEEKMKHVEKDEKMRLECADLLSSIKNVKRIIDNILIMAEIDSGSLAFHRERHELSEFLKSSLSDIKPYIGERKIRLELSEPPLSLLFDERLMKAAIFNVLYNAVENSPSDKEVILRLSLKEKEMLLSIIDEGPGIPEEIIPHIFKKFYAGSSTGGIGLGLAIVESVVSMHQGKIDVSSRVGGGTIFTLIFPLES